MSVRENAPQGVEILDPRGMAGRIYLGNQHALLHTKYRSCWSCGLREDNVFSFLDYKSMEANDLRGTDLDPRTWFAGLI